MIFERKKYLNELVGARIIILFYNYAEIQELLT